MSEHVDSWVRIRVTCPTCGHQEDERVEPSYVPVNYADDGKNVWAPCFPPIVMGCERCGELSGCLGAEAPEFEVIERGPSVHAPEVVA